MKHIFVAVMSVLLLCACEIETPRNGDLDGFWHLEAADTTATGGHVNLSEAQIFWAVEARLLCVSNYATGNSCYLRFDHEAKTLIVRDAYEDNRQEKSGVSSLLTPMGISTLPETFDVVTLTSSRMVLRSPDGIVLSFTKF